MIAASAALRVAAEPLAKDACEVLVGEQQALIAAGAKDDFGKGAEWGKANLPGDRLKQVGRYIDVEEQLSFRCGLARVRFSLPADEETPSAPEEPKVVPKAPPAPKATPAPKAKSKATGTKDAGTKDAPDAAAADAAAPASKPAPKVQAKLKPAPKPADPEPAAAKE